MEQPARPRRRIAAVAAVVLGVAGAVLLATSGSALWAVVRAAVAIALAGGLVLAQRSGPRVAGWSAVLVGVVVLPAAGGMAVDHLASGVVLRGSAALLTGLAAAVLVVAGAVSLLRTARRWWRLLALPVALVLLQFVMVPVGMAVLVTNRAHAELGTLTPADHGLEFEDVTLRTRDGVDLAAWWVPGDTGAAVVLLHGAASTRTATLDHAEALAGMGFAVLLLDARGHGDSGGTAMDLGWHGADDIGVAVDWLARRDDVDEDRIGAVGLSMGGEEALTAAAVDPRIRAVVAEGVGVRVAADARPEGWLPDTVNRMNTALTDVLTAASPPEALRDVLTVLDTAGTPTLIIAGAGEGMHAGWITGAADGGAVHVWDVPDAEHTRALDAYPEEWRSRVRDALARLLETPTG